MSYSTLITGPERRRRWSEEQKLELLAEAFGPGGNVTETARRADIHTSLLYRWRRATLTPPNMKIMLFMALIFFYGLRAPPIPFRD